MVAGSSFSNKRTLDEGRPLGRGMRIKQEPAHIQDPDILTGSITGRHCTLSAAMLMYCYRTASASWLCWLLDRKDYSPGLDRNAEIP